MNQSSELVRLLPHFLSVGDLLKRVSLNPVPDQLRHVLEESQITSLCFGGRVGPLHDFQQSDRLLVGKQRGGNQKKPGWVAFPGFLARSRHGWN